MYEFRLFLKAIGSRIFPFVMIFIFMVILLSNDNVIHSTKIADAIFTYVQNDIAPFLNGDATEIIGWVLFSIFCLFLLRMIVKVFSSDKKLFQSLRQYVASKGATIGLEYQKSTMGERYNRSDWSKIVDKNSPIESIHNTFSYRYNEVYQGNGKTITIPVEVVYNEISVFETWRPKTVLSTDMIVRVASSLPEVLLLSKLSSGRDSAVKLRLNRKDQYVALEGSFSNAFDVYVARGYETAALKVLTPNVMETIEPYAEQFDLRLNGHEITFMHTGYIFNTAKLAIYEKAVRESMLKLTNYLKKQTILSKTKTLDHETELFDPKIYSVNLVTDRLLLVCFSLILITFIVLIIASIFVHDGTVERFGSTYITMSPLNDILNLIMFGIFVFTLLTLVIGELEIALYRTRMYFRQKVALRYYKQIR